MSSLLSVSPTLFAVGAFSALLLYFLYRRALPRPIPGIPHSKKAASRILGDVPELIQHVKDTKGEFITFWRQRLYEHDSHIIQLFLRPFGRPFVIIADPRETQDVCMRRTKEFDRSDFFADLFIGTLPKHHISMKTTDQLKSQKRLLADTMLPAFLNEVAAPRIHEAMLDLIQLWNTKSKLAKGHPFSAYEDIAHAALDAIWIVTLGSVADTCKSQTKFLEGLGSLNLPTDIDSPVTFPEAPYPPAFKAIIALSEAMEPILSSPFPRIHHWFMRQKKSWREANHYKNQAIESMMNEAISRFDAEKFETLEHQGRDRSAIDHMIRRELLASKKENRQPQFNTQTTRDEIFGFLIAGHETTATTVAWSIKLLTENPTSQSKFRSILQSLYSAAYSQKRQPTHQEIATLKHPYIDALMEEFLRVGGTINNIIRVATVDTQLLGVAIPKGTDVFFLPYQGYVAPSLPAPREDQRSESSQAAKDRVGVWDEHDIQNFRPERWLKTDEKGQVEFDIRAGPTMPFGAGVRGCFGKKLAYVELRILIVMIIWNFELLPTPESLNSNVAVDRITHQPQYCYVRVKKVEW